ncbi:MAG: tetraacyldisaccharide 4'-kinase [Acidisphaera sp.]|nr:tetraacyldisaccharide 4'-kinase [Acidisphaera sp.]
MRAPNFWQADGGRLLPWLLAPAAALTARITASRMARPGWRAPVPVLCCGNVTVGGAGKTTLALDLGRRLTARGISVGFLSRGYGGRARGTRPVDPVSDSAALVGDEPLLLAAIAPTWIGADRAAAARAAVAAGAKALILDDGLQNPSLQKDFSLLVVDGQFGFGNRRLLPAGPLRETIAAAAARCAAAVLIGEDTAGAAAALPAGLPVLRARLLPDPHALAFRGKPVIAFAGIARPEKFFATLQEAGVEPIRRYGFPDHHRYTEASLHRLFGEAARLGSVLLTTRKDAVRIPAKLRARVTAIDVSLAWQDEAALDRLLDGVTGG